MAAETILHMQIKAILGYSDNRAQEKEKNVKTLNIVNLILLLLLRKSTVNCNNITYQHQGRAELAQ